MSTSACLLLLALPSTPATITIGPDGDYETFATAIAFIESEDDPDGYVLAVEAGTWVLDNDSRIDVNNLSGGLSIQPASSESTVILDGNSTTQPVTAMNVDLQMSGLTIRNGSGSSGAGILVSGGSLKLSDVIVEDCVSTSSGGGVYITLATSLEVTGCTFQDCTATASTSRHGGGIYCGDATPATISDSAFSGCHSGDRGGGVYVYNGTLSNVTFEDCTGRTGGGLYGMSSLHLTDCIFTSCASTANDGGAIATIYAAEVSLSACTFIGNTTARTGGAVSTGGDGTLDAQSCHFSSNAAYSGGGACVCFGTSATFTDCTFSANTAPTGGALALRQFNLSTPSVFSVETCSFDGNESGENGGAIYFSDWTSGYGGYTATIEQCQFTDNSALRGGGIYASASDPSSVTLDSCTMSSNVSSSSSAYDAINMAGSNISVSITNVTACDHRADREIDPDVVDEGGNDTGDWCCPGDVDGDSDINADDIASLLTSWGTDGDGDDRDDVDRDGVVVMLDLIEMLRGWGACG